MAAGGLKVEMITASNGTIITIRGTEHVKVPLLRVPSDKPVQNLHNRHSVHFYSFVRKGQKALIWLRGDQTSRMLQFGSVLDDSLS